MQSRFMKVGKLPGILIIDSSATVMSSFTMQKIDEARVNPKIMVRDYAVYDVKPKHYFKGAIFKVAVGNEKIRSSVIEKGEEAREEMLVSLGARIYEVPIEYKDSFDTDIDGAVQEILGVSLSATSLFISNFQAVVDCIEKSMKAGRMGHPMDVEEYICGEGGNFLWSGLSRQAKRKTPRGHEEEAWEPIVNPDEPRHVHFDLSKNEDSTGVAVGHVDRYVEVIRRGKDDKEYTEMAPVVYVDLVLQVTAPAGGEIILGEVRSLIYEMMERGFNVTFATYDVYQHVDLSQKLAQKGIDGELRSVDTDMTPYDTLKTAFYEGRINLYPYQILLDELHSLQRVMKGGKFKVDHPTDPKLGTCSKDVADALAGLCWSLTYKRTRRFIGLQQPVRDVKEEQDLILGKKPAKKKEILLPFLMGDHK